STLFALHFSIPDILFLSLLISFFLLFFFFYSYGAHRDLHSFPTRRSSDLRRVRPAVGDLFAHDVDGNLHQHRSRPPVLHLREERSEEHTSELQSRGHLVCRLLLEKKKKKKNTKKNKNIKIQTHIIQYSKYD